MFSSLKSSRLNCLKVVLFLALTMLSVSATARWYDLVVRVGDVLAPAGAEGIPIPIYIENYADTVAGFELWLVLDRPDIFEFQSETPPKATTLTFDTSGTLISGWEYVEAHSIGENGHDAKIVAQANTLLPPYTHGIGYPQSGDVPLIKILADVYELPPMPISLTAEIYIQADNLDNFGFSDENGNGIGVNTDTMLDTTCWNCIQWQDPPEDSICLQWELIPGTTGDSCTYDTVLIATLDSTWVEIYHGSLTAYTCGDVNGDLAVNIFDITDVISYLYLGAEPYIYLPWIGDVNGDGVINIFDITYLISYCYQDGNDPICDEIWLPWPWPPLP